MPPLAAFYWTLAALVGAWVVTSFEQRARDLGSYRMLLELIDMGARGDGQDSSLSAGKDEPAARAFLYAIGLLCGIAWPATLVLWIRSASGD